MPDLLNRNTAKRKRRPCSRIDRGGSAMGSYGVSAPVSEALAELRQLTRAPLSADVEGRRPTAAASSSAKLTDASTPFLRRKIRAAPDSSATFSVGPGQAREIRCED